MSQPKILLTGATGYVGGSVLTTLLNSQDALVQKSSITALVRKKEHADLLAAKGVTPVLFRDLSESEHLRDVASEQDVVIHAASGFHLGSAVALIEGLGRRKMRTGGRTSGTWNLVGSEMNEVGEASLFEHLEKLEARTPFLQRTTLLGVVAAAERHGVEAHILLPPDIYGRGTGLVGQHTPQLFDLVKGAIDAGHPEYVGDVKGGAGHVHIEDLASLFEVMVQRVLKGEDVSAGREGLFFSETGYHDWFDVAKSIGQVGVSRGVLRSAEPASIMVDEAARKYRESMGGDEEITRLSFCQRNKTIVQRAADLGWKPNKTDHDWNLWLEEVFDMVLSKRA
ncbi:hypothetical protein ACJZ2D_006175 [Fusarium nematophilum]